MDASRPCPRLDRSGFNATILRSRGLQPPSHWSSSGQSEQRSLDSPHQSDPVRTRNHIRHNGTRSGRHCDNSRCIRHLEIGYHAKVEQRSPCDCLRRLYSAITRRPFLPANTSCYRASHRPRVHMDGLGHVEREAMRESPVQRHYVRMPIVGRKLRLAENNMPALLQGDISKSDIFEVRKYCPAEYSI